MIPRKQQQQIKFLFRQRHRRPGFCDLHRALVDDHIANLNPVFAFPHPSQHRLHPGQQLHNFKWLDQVVVCPGPQPLNPVCNGALGCEKDHRGSRGFDLLQQAVAVHAREHNIQKNEVVGILQNEVCRRQTVIDLLAGIAIACEIPINEVGDGPFILHNQDSYHP